MNDKVGKRIQEYRDKINMSQEDMADAIGISVTAISNIERGANYPTFDNFLKITNILGVSSDLLLSDVVDAAYVAQASILSTRLENVSPEKRRQIFIVIDAILNSDY